MVMLLVACLAAFAAALLSAVAGFGGGVLSLAVFTVLFGPRMAVPVLTLVQLASNGSRVYFNRGHLHRRLIALFAVGAVPTAVAGAMLLAVAPATGLKRLLGIFVLAMLAWRRWRPTTRPPSDAVFIGVGAASGIGSALLGSVGPLTAPFFLAHGLVTDAYIGTDAAAAVVMHTAKMIGYGTGRLVDEQVLLVAGSLIPATVAGGWVGKRVLTRLHPPTFVRLVEVGMVVAAGLLIVG